MTFEQHSRTYGGQGQFAYGLAGGKGSYNQASYDSYRAKRCETLSTSAHQSAAEYYFSRELSHQAIAAWRDCMRSHYSFSCWPEAESDPAVVIISVSWSEPSDPLPTIVSSYLSHGTVRSGGGNAGIRQLAENGLVLLRNIRTIVVERDPAKTLDATIDATRGNASYPCRIHVPAFTAAPPPATQIARNVALTASISASSVHETTRLENAADGKEATSWLATGKAPAWIRFDFGKSIRITRVRLAIEQAPSGPTWHVLTGLRADGTIEVLHEFKQATHDRDYLEHSLGSPTEFVGLRVDTKRPDVPDDQQSWVSWREVEIYGMP